VSNDIIAALAGSACTAFFAVIVYFYRPKVSYDFLQIQKSFSDLDGQIHPPNGNYNDKIVVFERISIKNESWADIKNVILFANIANNPFVCEVVRSTSIAKNAVKFDFEDRSLKLSVNHLPRREELVIEYAYEGYSRSIFDPLRGLGGKYILKSKSSIRNERFGIMYGLLIAVCVAWVTHFILKALP
jgi:hypothetical protein